MVDQRINSALSRIEKALARIEATAKQAPAVDAALAARHENLRIAVSRTLEQLDSLIESSRS